MNNDILWVNSAGNSGQSSWFGVPTDTDGDNLLKFATEQERLNLNISKSTIVQLRWDGDWGAETTDLDLHLFDATGEPLAQSLNPQEGRDGNSPYEIAFPATDDKAYIQITSRTGDLPRWIQIVLWNGSIVGSTEGGSTNNPAESANSGMLTVGATHWDNTDTIEEYSSRGPTPDGRIKPDLVGVACGETALFGAGSPFCGTSQAAPHIAGLAALVRQRFPELSPQDVRQYLLSHAKDRGLAGPDNAWGAGLAVLPDPPPPTPTHTPTPTPTLHPVVEATTVAAREKFSGNCTICKLAGGWTADERAVFFQKIDYGDFIGAGNYLNWVEEADFITVPVAPGESESVPCEEGVVGNSLSKGENPTLNDYSHVVYVFVERQPGWRGCAGLSKDTDLHDIDRNVILGDAVNSWRPESMDVALEFLTDEKRSTSSVAYSRLPLRSGATAGLPIPGESLLCGPDMLPLAFWDDRNGFYAVSNDGRLALYPRAGDRDAARAVGTGWFFVLQTDESQRLVDSFCWRVPNWPDVPVRRCPVCQMGLR